MLRIITPGRQYEQLAKVMQVAIENALDKAADDIAEQLARPTKTWKHKVNFYVLKKRTGEREIVTTDKAFFFVTRGTRWRYAIMSPDFIAKTQPRVMSSGAGRGGVVMIGKKKLPGIKAREFEEEARDISQRTIANTFNRSISDALKEFHRGLPKS